MTLWLYFVIAAQPAHGAWPIQIALAEQLGQSEQQ